ncbi:MAG: polyphosphate:AMP phosphotransferase [Alphaproteobacteria bacterium]|nr:polyphosphate:AMP phosphotransferase [Alphaproteobacteria bacterium]
MFETAELGRTVSKKEFDKLEPDLRTELLITQRAIAKAGIPVVVIVSGVEGAGKGDLVNRLTSWMDARGMSVHVYWSSTDEERERPHWWRFWRTMPPRGTLGVLFGSWYTDPIVERAFDRIEPEAFETAMHEIKAFERMLSQDGTLFVKFWLHLSKDAQHKRWKSDAAMGRNWEVSPLTEEYGARYDAFEEASEAALRLTDTGAAPWYVVEAADARYRDLTVGRTLLNAMRARLTGAPADEGQAVAALDPPGKRRTVLDSVDLERSLDKKTYERHLAHWQTELNRLTWLAYRARRSTVVVFEGWDAAGKGGAIRRVIEPVDPRLMRVIPIASPTDEERAQHYLWRFWRHLPRAGFLTVYDRSWYGRVLVERVEGFAKPPEWLRSYHEINTFEQQLVRHGMTVSKFWLHISPDEQLKRFEERKKTPWKVHKITDEDWRNRKKWKDYELAVNDMVQHTSTTLAPWNLVPANDKRLARIEVLRCLCNAVGDTLDEEVAQPEP